MAHFNMTFTDFCARKRTGSVAERLFREIMGESYRDGFANSDTEELIVYEIDNGAILHMTKDGDTYDVEAWMAYCTTRNEIDAQAFLWAEARINLE